MKGKAITILTTWFSSDRLFRDPTLLGHGPYTLIHRRIEMAVIVVRWVSGDFAVHSLN